jgi:PBP1b-binding outer membrane lipoprotein LpoB
VKIVLLTVIGALLIGGCSNKPVKTATTEKGDKKDEVVYDTKKPISYAEYKKWRQANDPASEAYAEYKQWEINQRKWKLENDK